MCKFFYSLKNTKLWNLIKIFNEITGILKVSNKMKWRLKYNNTESKRQIHSPYLGKNSQLWKRTQELWPLWHVWKRSRGRRSCWQQTHSVLAGGRAARMTIVTLGCLNKNKSSTSDSPALAQSNTISFDNQLDWKRDGPGKTYCLYIWMSLLWKAHSPCFVTCHKMENNPGALP